ncbi:MAG: prolyl oligopeptidase family serine peptidase [Pseudomonadota bacterium]
MRYLATACFLLWISQPASASSEQCEIPTGSNEILQQVQQAASMLPKRLDTLAPNANLTVDWRAADGAVVLTNRIGDQYTVTLADNRVAKIEAAAVPAGGLADEIDGAPSSVSPNGRHAIRVEDYNLVAFDAETAKEHLLTKDGREDLAYGWSVFMGDGWIASRLAGDRNPPVGQWSPDGRYFATMRVDRRGLRDWPVVLAGQEVNGHRLPELEINKIALPGDERIASGKLVIVDTETWAVRETDVPPMPLTHSPEPVFGAGLQWSQDGGTIIAIVESRDFKTLDYWRVSAATGTARKIYSDNYEKPFRGFVGLGSLYTILGAGEQLILYSERGGGRGHFFLHDGFTGEPIRQLTKGDWSVVPRALDASNFDPSTRQFYFSAVGREANSDPYYRKYYRVNVDTGDIELLTPEKTDHEISLSVENGVFIDQLSTVDGGTTTVLRRLDGTMITTIAKTDLRRLKEEGWIAPQRVELLAADGVTPVWGTLILPTERNEDNCLPILDSVYAGPQALIAPVRFLHKDWMYAQATAQMGFAVLRLDSRGTPLRDPAFRDATFGRNFASRVVADDHAAAIRQLADRFSTIDPDRVGIYGNSWGGYYAARMMAQQPETFKVGVAAAGSHDNYLYPFEHDRWFGLRSDLSDTYDLQSNLKHAADIQGQLLLLHGTNDGDVHYLSSIMMAGALAEKNVPFEMLILPDRAHSGITDDPYVILKTWDFFARGLQGRSIPMRDVKFDEWKTGNWWE